MFNKSIRGVGLLVLATLCYSTAMGEVSPMAKASLTNIPSMRVVVEAFSKKAEALGLDRNAIQTQ